MHQRKDGTWAMQMVCGEELKEEIAEYMQEHDIESDSVFLTGAVSELINE